MNICGSLWQLFIRSQVLKTYIPSEKLTENIKVNKMITVQTKRVFQNTIGDGDVLPNIPKWCKIVGLWERTIIPIVYSFSLLSIMFSISIDFVSNVGQDLICSCTSFMSVLGLLLLLAHFWYYLINRNRFYSLFDEVERIVNERA